MGPKITDEEQRAQWQSEELREIKRLRGILDARWGDNNNKVIAKQERIDRLEEALRVIARSSTDRITREDALAALLGDPRKT